MEESSNEKASGSRIASINYEVGVQEGQKDLFRIDRLKMVSYLLNMCNYNHKSDFDFFNQGQSQNDI